MEHFLALLVVVLGYLFLQFPVSRIILSVIVIAWYIIHMSFKKLSIGQEERMRRKQALEKVALFLSPYEDCMRNLKLSNKFCYLRLGADGVSITARELGKSYYRKFRVITSKIHPYPELWNMFCLNFSINTTYDSLLESCRRYGATILDSFAGEKSKAQTDSVSQSNVKYLEKVDINNASEMAITALPGINIVMAKRIVRKREEIGGFKDKRSLFIFLKLSSHMENQLKNLIEIKKMKGSLKPKINAERQVDL